ncbi:MAG TPA: AI-2E family transporter [Tepidisphaeraceae bacterium]|nr:AI-2E family transporter [Tepidisphaeraceae bacterium]
MTPHPPPSEPSPGLVTPATPVAVRHLVAVFVWGALLVFFFFFLAAFKLVLLGLLAAVCLTALLRPILHRLPGPRGLKGFLLGLAPLLICAGLLFVCIWWLVKPIRNQMKYWPQTQQQFNGWLGNASAYLGLSSPLTVHGLVRHFASILVGNGFLQGVTGNMIDVLVGIVFVFVGTIYMLAEPAERIIPAIVDLLPIRRQSQLSTAIHLLEPRLRWWLVGAVIMVGIIGATSLLGFWIIGLKLFIPLGILAGISEFVPTIGPLLAFLVALAFAATQGTQTVIWLVSFYVFVHVLESYILIPLVYKKAVRVPTIVTLFTVVLWGEIFGIGGLLLAIPINLFLWTLAENFIGRSHAAEVPAPPKEAA